MVAGGKVRAYQHRLTGANTKEFGHGENRSWSRKLPYPDVARLRRDTAALSGDRSEDQASRQGRPAGDLCRTAGKGRSEDGGDDGAGRAGRTAKQSSRRDGAAQQDTQYLEARCADRDERRSGRGLS